MYLVFAEKVCKKRLWAFERIPNKILPNRDNAVFFTATKDACLASCLNEARFICRSVEYNYKTRQCQLSNSDRRSASKKPLYLKSDPDTDYFENACLKSKFGRNTLNSKIVPMDRFKPQ